MNGDRFLIVKYRGLGDAVMGLSTLQYLRELFPSAFLAYGVPAWIAPLFTHTHSAADAIIPLDLKSPRGWGDLFLRLRRERFDQVLELFQSGRTGHFFRLAAPLLGFRYRFHNQHLKNIETGVRDQGVVKAAIQRDLDAAYSFLSDRKVIPDYTGYVPRLEVAADSGRYLVLGVVGTRATKSWKAASFARLTHLLAARYPGLDIRIPLSSNAADAAQEARLLQEGLPRQVKMVRVPLASLPGLLAGAQLYIGNDTGLKHIAVAVGVRTITLFGPEPPLEWHPYDRHRHPYFYRDGLDCRTAQGHYCALSQCDSMICLDGIAPESVFETVEHTLQDGNA